MDNLGRVQVLDAAEDLIQKHLDMILGQMLRRYNDFVQIRLHELSDHINLLKEVDVRGLKKRKENIYEHFRNQHT